MEAKVGSWLVVHGCAVDAPVREGEIIGIAHPDGSPPYVVRWTDTDRESLVFPGPDSEILPYPPHSRATSSRQRRAT